MAGRVVHLELPADRMTRVTMSGPDAADSRSERNNIEQISCFTSTLKT